MQFDAAHAPSPPTSGPNQEPAFEAELDALYWAHPAIETTRLLKYTPCCSSCCVLRDQAVNWIPAYDAPPAANCSLLVLRIHG